VPARPLDPRARTTVQLALASWVVLLVAVLLAPSTAGPDWLIVTIADGLGGAGLPPALISPRRVEFMLNVAAFVPLSLLGTMLWPRPTWRDWTAAGFAASFVVEVAQALVLDTRAATHSDVVANTLGTLVGALIGWWLVAWGVGRGSEDRADLPDRHSPAEELDPPR
jgi:Na+/glutamate symporter